MNASQARISRRGSLMSTAQVGGLRKHPFGRVDQLEDRYLGMVEAPSSNLGTSTRNDSCQVCWTCATASFVAIRGSRWLGTSTSTVAETSEPKD